MCAPLGENDIVGLNVTLWEGRTGVKEGENITQRQYVTVWEEGHHEKGWKISQSAHFVIIQVKKSGRFVTVPEVQRRGFGRCKIPGCFVRRQNVKVDVASG